MDSILFICNYINSLKEQLLIEKELNTGNDVYCELEIKYFNQVLNDLKCLDFIKKELCLYDKKEIK